MDADHPANSGPFSTPKHNLPEDTEEVEAPGEESGDDLTTDLPPSSNDAGLTQAAA